MKKLQTKDYKSKKKIIIFSETHNEVTALKKSYNTKKKKNIKTLKKYKLGWKIS